MKTIPEKYMKLLTDKNGFILFKKKEINDIIKLGKEITMKPKKGKQAKGGVFIIEGNKNLSLDKVRAYAEKLTKHCDDDAHILWGAVIRSRIRKTKVTPFYVY
jgi:cell division GTPase FtsZ